MKTFKLISCKGDKVVRGTLEHAIGVAIALEAELMPAWGVQVEDASGKTMADIQGGVDVTAVCAEDDWKRA